MHGGFSKFRSLARRATFAAVRALGAVSAVGVMGSAYSQEFPVRPITIVVPFAPGGPDRIARLVAEKLQGVLKQPVVLDYKPGATGLIGAGFVQRAKPDGYTLLFTGNSGMVVAPMLRQPPPFDVAKDFAPVSMIMRYPMFLTVPPKHPANTIAELVAMGKAKPNSINFGSPGIGSVGQLATEIFARSAGITMTHIPYKGIGDAQAGLMAGDIQLYLDGPLSSAELVKAGRVRPLAVTGDKRITAFPNVPSMKELGYPSVNSVVWIAIFAPKGTPDAILNKLSDEIARIVKSDEIRDQISQGGLAEAVGSTALQLSQAIEAESPGFAQLVKELNLRVE